MSYRLRQHLEAIGLAVLLAANVVAWGLVGLLAMILWQVAV